MIENGGIIVCRTKHLVLAGGGKVKNYGAPSSVSSVLGGWEE